MNILSIHYLIFLAISVAVYYVLPKTVQWCWLLIISLTFFVASCGWQMVPYLLFGVMVTYFGATAIGKTEDPKKKKTILVITLVLTLGELSFLKYLNFFPETGNAIASLLGKGAPFETISILAPIGVSYYTLAIVGYVLDVYWGTYEAQKNPFKHMLFTCYFPQMISGPVTRYGQMRRELFEGRKFDYTAVTFGAQRILWGFFKKLLIAENLSPFVELIFGDVHAYAGTDLIIATVCYAFYIYADFSGCMDIVLGSSELFGVKLPENFERPFFSVTISEFWRRWHISLGVWFKENLLYPVLKSDTWQKIRKFCKKKWGKKAAKSIPTYLGLCVLWLSIGFWHQGSWLYLLASGMIPGAYLMLSDALEPTFKAWGDKFHFNRESLAYRLLARVRTVGLVCTIFFVVNCGSIPGWIDALGHLFTNFGLLAWFPTIWVRKGIFVVPGLALLVVLYVSIRQESGHNVRQELAEKSLPVRWFIYIAMILAVLLLSPDLTEGLGGFIYAQF